MMTRILSQSSQGLEEAANLLRKGAIVAFGTETVYGLGAISTSPESIARVFAAKNRPHFNPLISHFPSVEDALEEVVATPQLQKCAANFWPGPLTLILKRRAGGRICDLACAGLDTVAIRVPAHKAAQALLRRVGTPVAAPSANRSGRISPTTVDHVLSGLTGRIDAVVDMGECPVGVESTVLDLSGDQPRVLRPGGVTFEALEAVLGPLESLPPKVDNAQKEGSMRSPGLMTSHYAPLLPIRLDAVCCQSDEALLAFGAHPPPAALTWNLSATGDLVEAASRLYAGLHYLDDVGQVQNLKRIAVMPLPESGMGRAILDRLQRAAAPRPPYNEVTRREGGR